MNTATAIANSWEPAALIVFGYLVAAFWQNKRIDDLKTWLDAEFRHISQKFELVNDKLDKLNNRFKSLEDARGSGVAAFRS